MFVSILADELLSIRSELNENIFKIDKEAVLSFDKFAIPLDYDKFSNMDIELKTISADCQNEAKDTFKLKSLGN